MEREIGDFQSLDIGLYPLVESPWAAGKSGFKAIQYMAVGIPYVVTPVGACAEIGVANETHLVAATQEEWCNALAQLLSNTELRARMGEAGRRYAVQHYAVAAQADKLAAALREAALYDSRRFIAGLFYCLLMTALLIVLVLVISGIAALVPVYGRRQSLFVLSWRCRS
jgi:hypothetical protein